jgi:hypothetical protein
MESAYAAGNARRSTRIVEVTLAVIEFARYGHGLVPVPCPKNCR